MKPAQPTNARQSPSARRRRAAPSYRGRVLAICIAFGVLIAAGSYAAKGPGVWSAVFKSAGGAFHGATGANPAAGTAGTGNPDAADAASQFAKTGIGDMLFATTNSDTCRRVLFDNRTGAFYQAGETPCARDEPAQAGEASPATRLDAMRKAFQVGKDAGGATRP